MKKIFLTLSLLVGVVMLSSFTTGNKVEQKAYLVTVTNSCGMTETFGTTDETFYDNCVAWESMCDD